MRISDWSSDVCSSDLTSFRVSKSDRLLVAHVFELQRQFELTALEQGHYRLQVITLLAADAHIVAVDLRFDFDFRLLDCGDALFGNFLFVSLLYGEAPQNVCVGQYGSAWLVFVGVLSI